MAGRAEGLVGAAGVGQWRATTGAAAAVPQAGKEPNSPIVLVRGAGKSTVGYLVDTDLDQAPQLSPLEDGVELRPRALQAEENETAEREGRKPVEPPHTVPHYLRHFFASALIAGGASVKQVQLVLGHASAAITLRVYAHLRPGEEDRTRAVMDAVLGGLRTGHGPQDQGIKETAGQLA